MITNTDYLKYAFAENGDKADIPDEPPSDDSVNLSQGYGSKYQQNPEADGLLIKRDSFNGLMNLVTSGVRDFQINGTRLWDSAVQQAGGYPAGARVSVYLDMGTNRITNATPTTFTFNNTSFYMSSTITLVSLIDNNTYDPSLDNNLFKYWWVDDGNDLFYAKMALCSTTNTYFPAPPGYVDLGSNTPDTTYNYSDYPRVYYFKQNNTLPAYIEDNSSVTADTFKITDLRGRFPRIWSNGHDTIDPNRVFDEEQGDAMRDFWIGWFRVGSTDGSTTYYPGSDDANTSLNNTNAYFVALQYGGSGTTYRGGSGSYLMDIYAITPSLGNSYSNIPISGDNLYNEKIISSDTAEIRPHNFCVRMYMKL